MSRAGPTGQAATRRKGGGKALASRALPSVHAKALPAGARAAPAGDHEVQADRAAEAFLLGHAGLAAGLSSAPVAGFTLPGSLGEPLPGPLALSLGTAFGADLAPLRVHLGRSAQQAARGFGARAFAAGQHVYFAAGAYDPAGREGQRLIAHEVAHVLQQTGIRAADGGLRLAGWAEAGGAVQCQPAGSTPPPSSDEAAFTAMSDGTLRTAEGQNARTAIEMARAALALAPSTRGRIADGTLAQPVAYGAALVAATRRSEFNALHPVGKGFIVDCLKRMGYFERAREILRADAGFLIRVGSWNLDFADYLANGEGARDWVGGALTHAEFHGLWPDAAMNQFRRFLLRPHSAPLPLPQSAAQAHAQATERYNTALREHRLIPQEAVVLAWQVLDGIHADQFEHLQELQAIHGEISAQTTPMHQRVILLTQLRADWQAVVEAPDSPPHRRQYAQALLSQVGDLLPFWQGCQADFEAVHARFAGLEDRAVVAPLPPGEASPLTLPVATALHDAFLPAWRTLFEMGEDGMLPSSDAYGAALQGMEQAVAVHVSGTARRTLLEQLDAALADEFDRTRPRTARPGHRPPPPPNRDRLRALVTLIFWVDFLRVQARRYDQTKDDKSPHFVDERAGHRIRMARHVAALARWMRWADVLELCDPVLAADYGSEGELWLITDWEPDAVQSIGRLADDFPNNRDEPFPGTPFTARHLVDWFRLDYNRRLARTLDLILLAEDRLPPDGNLHLERLGALVHERGAVGEVTGDAESQYAQSEENPDAMGAGMDLTRPQRFVVRDWVASLNPESEIAWPRLLATRPKTRLQLERHLDIPAGPSGDAERADLESGGPVTTLRIIYPVQPELGVFAWVLPSLVPMIRFLAGLPEPRNASLAAETAWLRSADPYLMSPVEWDRFDARIRRLMEAPLARLREELPDRLRRLSALQRRVLTPRMRDRMRSYLGGPGMENSGGMRERFATPRWAVDEVETLRRNTYPRDEQELQIGLLLLSLAPEYLGFARKPLDAAYFNQQAYADIIATLAIVDDTDRLAAMRRCATHVNDEAGNIVYIERNLRAATAQLRQAKQAMEDAAREAQSEIGYRGTPTDGPQGSITPLSRATPIYANEDESQADTWRLGMRADDTGHIDWSTGTRYQIQRVHRAFTFYQGIGSATPEGMREGAGGAHAPARLEFAPGDERPASGEARLLFTMLIDGVATPVTENDTALLARLNDIFLWRSFGIGMENTAALSEAAMQWIITVVGVVQPEVAYAELATNLVAMAADGEFDELVNQLYHDPVGLVQDIVTRFSGNAFRADHLWRFLLLNSGTNPLALLGGLFPSRTRARSHPPTTRLGRVVAALRDLGLRITRSVEIIKRNTAGPLRSAQATISLRPRLAWLLLRAADFISFMGDQVPPSVRERIINGVVELASGEIAHGETDEGVLAGLVDLVREQISDSAGEMEQSARRLLEGLATLELPGELINLELATELILQFILDRFGPRGRAYRLVMELFPIPEYDSRTGGRFEGMRTLFQWVSAQIAAAWRDTTFDPNRYWRLDVLPVIAGYFDRSRDELVDTLYDASDFVLEGLGRPHFPRPTGLPPTVPDPVLLDPAVQGGPVGTVHRSPGWRLPRSPGAPLPDATRADFESRFGVRLRHVRLHEGEEGRAATEPVGARAVTSGSHIYRHPDEPRDGQAAQRLLAHELAHVVQQLGPRPEGPRFGRSGAGLVLDVAAERRADTAADRAIGGATPATPTGTGVDGVQPAFETAVARDILNLLSTTGARGDFETPAGGVAVPGIEQAQTIWRAVHACFGDAPRLDFAPFMHEPDVKTALQALLRDPTHVAQVETHLAGIANLAQRRLARARRTARVSTELDPARFVTLLEGYLFAAFGVAMQVNAPAPGHNVTGIAITNVDLGRVAIDHLLWDRAMRPLPDSGGAIRRELHARLGVLGPSRVPQPGLFAAASFEFSAAFVEDYRSLQRARNADAVSHLPNASNYRNTTGADALGLRLATHKELKGRGVSQQMRESHHMSQYLLAQFFANVHDRRIIPAALRDAVNDGAGGGIVWDGSMVAELGHGGRRLRFTAMDVTSTERGGNMPAILLAARTHKRGRLHVEREGQWDDSLNEASGTRSQGNAIRNAFNAALPRDLRTDDASPAQAARIRAWYAAPANAGKGARPYYDAAVATYHWMYGRMIPALEAALHTEERAYYDGVAAISHPGDAGYRLSEADMNSVFSAAKRYHDTTMQTRFGWPTP